MPKMQGIINVATLENKKPRIEILRLKKSKSISLKNIDWRQLANSVFEKYRKKSKGDGLWKNILYMDISQHILRILH